MTIPTQIMTRPCALTALFQESINPIAVIINIVRGKEIAHASHRLMPVASVRWSTINGKIKRNARIDPNLINPIRHNTATQIAINQLLFHHFFSIVVFMCSLLCLDKAGYLLCNKGINYKEMHCLLFLFFY